PVAGVDDDRFGLGVELSGLDQLLQGRDGDTAGGLGEDALGPGQQLDALDDLFVTDVRDHTAGTPGDVEHVRAVRRVADRARLAARGVVRGAVAVHERPALLLTGDLGGQLVHVVIVALDGDQRAAVHGGGDDLGALEIAGDEDDRADAGASRGGGDGVGKVAG